MAHGALRLRATRASPPGLVPSDDTRRAIFAAAIQQAEDLFAAAGAIGPFGRPIPLYYAMSQAGRAMVAAWSGTPEPPPFHGLTQDRETDDWRTRGIQHFRVRPQARQPGEFGVVASTMGLPGLTGSVELGALWSALPGDLPYDDDWPLALPVWPEVYVPGGAVLHIGAAHRGFVFLREQAPDDDVTAITTLLGRYPGAARAEVEAPDGRVQRHPTPWGMGPSVKWPAPPAIQDSGDSASPELLQSYVTSRVPEYRHRKEHWLVPIVGEGSDEMPPLLLWWVLIFGLSLLARYEPAAWRSALDPDRSQLAVPLEQLLDTALEVTPGLLYEAITHESSLLPPRL
jgi:hypothetical protein